MKILSSINYYIKKKIYIYIVKIYITVTVFAGDAVLKLCQVGSQFLLVETFSLNIERYNDRN